MNPFCTFMASNAGRIARIVAGIGLIAWAVWGLHGVASAIVALVGLVPLAAGLFDFCVFAPLFGCPMSGERIRSGSGS